MQNLFEKIISLENLFLAWEEFRKGKQYKKDVMAFEYNLEQNIFELHQELQTKTYRHGPYTDFFIQDPKQRHIHKALVRDRIVHHAVFSALNPLFEPTFIFDSFACRKRKGTHKAINRLRQFLQKVSKSNTKDCFILKCDIRKFFHSVGHTILIRLIAKRVRDKEAVWLIREIVDSFPNGIPIGNLTSQLFANVYLNELDQFMKHALKIPCYIRYNDDFAMVSNSRNELENWLPHIQQFLSQELRLTLHPQKIFLKTYHQGIDFLGYVQFPHHRILRTKTKRRILKKISGEAKEQSLHSYLGVLSHANSHKFSEDIRNLFWFNK